MGACHNSSANVRGEFTRSFAHWSHRLRSRRITSTTPIPTSAPDHTRLSPTSVRPAWIVAVAAAGLISVMTAPGQTAGLSVFTDPLIEQLGISRTEISFSYMIGTLLGAMAQPFLGRALDRWDPRRVMVIIAISFSLILVSMSFVSGVIDLTIGYTGLRMAGQGALGLAVTTAITRAITHRRGLALGISAAVGSAGISLAPIGLERLIDATGIQAAWRWEALAVAVIVIPAALLLPRAHTSHRHHESHSGLVSGWTLREATRTGMFWVLVAATSTISMLGTGLMFQQVAILAERGLSPLEAASNFVPQTITALAATVTVGALVDQVSPRIFVIVSMAAMAAALCMVTIATPGWGSISYGLVLGLAGGALRGMEAATFARYYGVAHIGSIRGVATSIGLAASAFGPLAFAVASDVTGNFTTPALVFAILPAVILVAVTVVRSPETDPVPIAH